MALFDFKPRSSKITDAQVVNKAKSKLPILSAGNVKLKAGNLSSRITSIKAMTNRYFADKKDMYLNVMDEAILIDLIDKFIENGIGAIDTETTSLDPITTTLAGVCLYTPGYKAAYVPVNHVSYMTGMPIKGQISAEIVKRELQRLIDAKVKIDMFNSDFDCRVLKHTLSIKMFCWWDGYIAQRLLDENNKNNSLKGLWDKYVNKGKDKSHTFSELFAGIPFTMIPVDVAYLYAANDPMITYELAEFQRPFLTDTEVCREYELQDVAKIFHELEMPLVPIVSEMEDTGVFLDLEVQQKLSEKYNKLMSEAAVEFEETLSLYESEIEEYRIKQGSSCKLPEKINPASPEQLSILLYDIMKLPPVSKKKPRGTGEEILEQFDNPLVTALLKFRKASKLVSTYVDKFPKIINAKTGRIHARFNQLGTITGRFSSDDPNLQNIPSHAKDIRKMFKASDGYVMLSCDYSAQEPRLTVHLAQDEKGIQAYIDGKDLYAEIASLAFNVPYDDCLEFRPDGTHNPEGKERRSRAKAILLGINYDKGIPAIADDLHISKKLAQEIYDAVLNAFPKLKTFREESRQMARDLGYVTTAWGRKRRLPDMQLDTYEFYWKDGVSKDYDPLADDEDQNTEVPEEIVTYYWNKLAGCKSFKQHQAVIEEANNEGIKVVDNRMKIADATRMCVNARVQGSAADLTKFAMLSISRCEELKQLGFRLLIQVHDEIIGECPEENKIRCAELLSECMINAASLSVPLKCDVEITKCWYENE